MNSSLISVPRLLHDPAAFFASVRRGKNIEAQTCWLVVSSIVCLAIHGFVMGLSHSLLQALSSAVKMPILVVGTGLFCLPALYFFALALGSSLRLAQVAAVILAGISVTAFLLLGLSPVMLIFVLTSESYAFFQLLAVAFVAISGCIGVWYLWRGILEVNLLNERAPTNLRRALIGAWFALYIFVGSQMSWRLSPLVGDPALPFVLLQPSHGNLYVDVMHALQRVLGLEQSLWNMPPLWVGGACLVPLVILILGTGLAASIEKGQIK
jgi:hypothetical protein